MQMLLIASLVLSFAGAALAQPPPPPPRPPMPQRSQTPATGTAVIRGFVVAADTGNPIRRAQVAIGGARVGSRVVLTDAQGRFEIRQLTAARYSLTASKAGFVTLRYGQRRAAEPGTPIELADGQVVEKVVIALPRGSVISGTITDEFGEPLANANVSALRYSYVGGMRQLRPAEGQNARDTTDDKGQFRLFGLAPGEYLVSGTVRPVNAAPESAAEEATGYAPTYFPGVANTAEAQRVRVDIGQEQSGVIFALLATRLVRISGTVFDSQGVPLAEGALALSPSVTSGAPMLQQNSARTDRAGQFRFNNIPPGRYVLTALRRQGGGRGSPAARAGVEMAHQEITIGNEDLTGVVLTTLPGARVQGRIVTDTGAAPPFSAAQLSIDSRSPTPNAAGPTAGSFRANADWTFELSSLFQSRIFRINAPEGWTLKQIVLNGQDITDTPIELAPGQNYPGMQVVITQKIGEVSGSLVDTRGAPITDAAVVVFPADSRQWTFQSRFIRSARPDQQGRFVIRGLPEHDRYLAVAVQELEEGQAADPEFLAAIHEQGTSFSLGEGETKTIDLRMRAR